VRSSEPVRKRRNRGNCAPPPASPGCGATKASTPRRELLAPIYGWFTEGFDTLDIKEAKALLEGLADAAALPASGGLWVAGASAAGG
jgi:hypothetical protein